MALDMIAWLVAIPMMGVITGLRTMTGMAVLCWFSYFGQLPVHHSWAVFTTKLVTAVVFTVLAVGEYIGDKLPQTPARISLFPLLARLAFAGLVGAVLAAGLKGSGTEGVILAELGALVGAFVGYLARRDLVSHWRCPDWYVALAEDGLAICGAVLAMSVITG